MSARLADSDITTLWVVPGGIADIEAGPTITELTAALNITCAVVEGYELGMQPSDNRDSVRSVCDKGNIVEFGAANYAGNLTFLREGDIAAVESAYLEAAGFFTDRNKRFDLVRRGGVADSPESAKPHDSAPVAGDVVEVYGFVTDYPQYRSGQNANSDATFTVPLGQQSRFNTHVEIVAP